MTARRTLGAVLVGLLLTSCASPVDRTAPEPSRAEVPTTSATPTSRSVPSRPRTASPSPTSPRPTTTTPSATPTSTRPAPPTTAGSPAAPMPSPRAGADGGGSEDAGPRGVGPQAVPPAAEVVPPQAPTPPPPPAPPAPPPAAPPAGRPAALSGSLFVDRDSAAAQWVAAHPNDPRAATIRDRIASVPTARWFLRSDDTRWVRAYVDAASASGTVPLLVAYHIPHRDCGSHSSGGAADAQAYRSWIRSFAQGIGRRPAVVLLEPDSLYYIPCLDQSALADRLSLLAEAVQILRESAPQAVVYLDGGTPVHGTTAAQMADLLVAAGVQHTRGFAANINNVRSDDEAWRWAVEIRRAVAERTRWWPSFVLDTSRNGAPVDAGVWCNPPQARLGATPQWFTDGTDGADGRVWFKRPGESDGSCGAAPSSASGEFRPELAAALAGG